MNEVELVMTDELREALERGEKVKAGGYFTVEHFRNGELIHRQISENIVVDEGLDHLLDVALSNGTQNSTWYVGIYSNNYTPIAGNVAATFAGAGVADEITTEVDETARPTWTEPGVSTQSITNSASPAVFTANTSVNAYGAFLISNNTMGGTTGVLMAASKFASVRALVNTDTLNVTYTLNIADA